MISRVTKASRVTWVGLFVDLALTFLKLLAGVWGQSVVMIADAFHSLSDLATDIVVLFGFKIVDKPADKSHDYGHGKVETLTTVIIGVILLIVGFRICWFGLCRVFQFYQGQIAPRPGLIAFYAAIISIISKECLYRYTAKVGRAINSQAIIANAWHHRSDAFSSVGAMVGIGGAIILGEKWYILDPIAAIIVSLFIIKTAIVISTGAINELLEVSLSDEEEDKILSVVRSVPGAEIPHNLKTRRIGSHIAIDLHIKVNKNLNITEGHVVSINVEEKIKEVFGSNVFISVHIEPLG